MLRDSNTLAAPLQARFLEHVSAETLLVGHALENDLRVLKVHHQRVLDTAILFPHPKVCALLCKRSLAHPALTVPRSCYSTAMQVRSEACSW